MDTEALAVAAVKSAIAKTDYLVDYIKDKDKEPMWDGSIYAYKTKRKSNVDWSGKAAVQVKGINIETLDVTEIKYDLEVVDLKNYKRDGGLLFFVVGIDNNGDTKIFYRALTPYLINQILTRKEQQKTIRECFYVFPTKKNEICNVVMDFIRDAKKQELFTHDEIPTLEEFISSAGNHLTYGFQYSGIGYSQSEPYTYLFGHEFYMYAKNTKLDITFPIEHIHKIEAAMQDIDGLVTIADKVYYEGYKLVHKSNAKEVHIGKSTVIVFISEQSTVKVNFNLKGNIKEQINDIGFILDFLENKVVKINGMEVPIEPTNEELESFNVEEMKNIQEHLILIDSMLGRLGVTKALDISNLSTKDAEYLDMLHSVFEENKTISFKEKKIPPVSGVTIANIYLALHFRQMTDGIYHIDNFPDIEYEVSGEYPNGEKFITSKYVILKAKDLIRIDNFDCTTIVDDLLLYGNEGHLLNSNLLLLEIIKAYDQTKKEIFLTEATRLAEWLKRANCLDGISTINYLQCVARQSELTDEQEVELMDLLKKYDDNEQMKVGIHILLGNYKMAKRCLDKLDVNQRNEFYDFPIYALMK